MNKLTEEEKEKIWGIVGYLQGDSLYDYVESLFKRRLSSVLKDLDKSFDLGVDFNDVSSNRGKVLHKYDKLKQKYLDK